MVDGKDFDAFAMVVETDAIISEAQTKFGWLDALKPFHVSRFGGEEPGQAVEELRAVSRSMARTSALACSAQAIFFAIDQCREPFDSPGRGVCPMRSKSAIVRPKSARTSS